MEEVVIFKDVTKALTTFPIFSSKVIKIASLRICITRLEDGFYAIDDTCPHEKASLAQGKCSSNGLIECPWHHYLFDIKTGKNLGNTCADLTSYQVNLSQNRLSIIVPN